MIVIPNNPPSMIIQVTGLTYDQCCIFVDFRLIHNCNCSFIVEYGCLELNNFFTADQLFRLLMVALTGKSVIFE